MSQNSSKRRIGVLMPIYNGEKYLRAAIDSILNQSYAEFDFYIINDGSSDGSENIILSYQDDRIHYLKNEENKGLVYTLNRGLDAIQNEFIARMDQDDLAVKDRFRIQLSYMDSDKELGACGCQVRYFDESGNNEDTITEFPLTHEMIRAKLLLANAIVHPAVLIRSNVISENNLRYREDHAYLEDYDFWIRFSQVSKVENISDVLMNCRRHGENMTSEGRNKRLDRYKKLYREILESLSIAPSEENLQRHLELAFRSEIKSLKLVHDYMGLILSQNEKLGIYPKHELKFVLDQAWRQLFFVVESNGFGAVVSYWRVGKSISLKQFKYLTGKLFKRRKQGEN